MVRWIRWYSALRNPRVTRALPMHGTMQAHGVRPRNAFANALAKRAPLEAVWMQVNIPRSINYKNN